RDEPRGPRDQPGWSCTRWFGRPTRTARRSRLLPPSSLRTPIDREVLAGLARARMVLQKRIHRVEQSDQHGRDIAGTGYCSASSDQHARSTLDYVDCLTHEQRKGRRPSRERLPRLTSFTLSRIQVRRVHTCSAFPAPEIGPGRLVGAKPTGPELTLTRRCW